jgi:molecular chaperone DnaK
LEVGEGVFEVKSTSGDTHLGGDDWGRSHRSIGQLIISEGTGDLIYANDRQALQRLRRPWQKRKKAKN